MLKLKFIIFCTLLFSKPSLGENSIVVQSTTSTYNSGFYNYILPIIKSEINVTAHVVSVGTGAALKNALNCDGDVIIVHAKKRELDFVEKGFGVKRFNLMYNDFIIVGPKNNSANIIISDDPIEAFEKIFNTSSIFISRGDDSGTHFKEMSIWEKAKLKPRQFSGSWYREVGSGMGATLNLASGMGGYTITDRASWVNFNNKNDLKIVAEKNKLLFNQYGIIMVNPLKCPNTNTNDAKKFINWLISSNGQEQIKNFKVKNQQLFFPNAN
jgi:tungstate transport system substrate-binding protein